MTRVPIPPLSGVPAIAGVTLRHWAETDVVPITAACQDAEIQRWTGVPADYQDQYARNFIASSEANRMKGAALEVAVAAVGDGSVLGSVGLIKLDFANARGEVGYWVAPQARGRGVATAAVRLITGVGFDRLGLMRLDLLAATGNEASQRVAEQAGFTREGVMRSYLATKEGVRDDAVMFGLVRNG